MAKSPDSGAMDTANQALASLPFGSLIGGPLVAAIEAQAKAARSTTEFIESVGFNTPTKAVGSNTTPPKTLRTADFSFESDGKKTNLTVPFLTMVPIPFIRIESMNINFKANISASADTSSTDTSSEEFKANASLSVNYWAVEAKFDASYSSKKDSTATANSKYAVEYTMDISVHAVQDDIPAGLAKVLSILSNSISSTTSDAPKTPPKSGT